MNMNISTLFQPVSGVVLNGRSPCFFPPFLAVWCGQTKAKAAFADDKLLVALFCVLVNQFAEVGEASGIGGQSVFEISVVRVSQ